MACHAAWKRNEEDLIFDFQLLIFNFQSV